MRTAASVGIVGLGVHLPEEIRTNEWWPPEIVASWRTASAQTQVPGDHAPEGNLTEGARRTIAAMSRWADDPFAGAVERRVWPPGTLASDVGAAAAQRALQDAAVDPRAVDLLLNTTTTPDYPTTATAWRIHQLLGLSESCFTGDLEAGANSFAMQLTLAEQMIRTGQSTIALLVQSSLTSDIVPRDTPFSPWFGDGASAVVVGPVSELYGVLGSSHRTDADSYEGLVLGVRGRRWFDEGQCVLYAKDAEAARKMFLRVADRSKRITGETLEKVGLTTRDVDFFASHQGTRWLRSVAQDFAGLSHARTLDTFSWAGSLLAANVPLVLATARERGLLRQGDIVVTLTGGPGGTWSSVVLRWGGT